jgi:hypothetical protein
MDVLRSQGLGVACGLATVALLAIGSVVMAATADGASAGIAMDDVRPFLERPSPWHAWFYALVVVLAVYALNVVLCTWDQSVRLWRTRSRSLRTWAPVVIHAAFPLALVAHGVGGLWGEERGMVTLGPDWTALPDGREARVTDVVEETHPDGRARQTRVAVDVRSPGGEARREEVSWNGPLSSGLGSDLLLLARTSRQARSVGVAIGDASCEAPVGGTCRLGDHAVVVKRAAMSGHWGDTPVAFLRVEGPDKTDETFLWTGGEARLRDGATVRVTSITDAPTVLLRSRHAPGNPWALAAAVVLAIGLVMMGRRWA